MEIHVTSQGLAFLIMLLCGMTGGLLFDFFRAVRKLIPMNGVWVSICDLLFWGVYTVAVFYSARLTNQGELRWYEFIGLGFGLSMYFLLFGSLVANWLSQLLLTVIKIILLLVRVVLIPIRIISRPILFLYKKTIPFRKKLLFSWSVWKQKWMFSRKQLKKIVKRPKIFLFWY